MSSQPPTSGIQQTQDGTRIIPQSRRPDGSIRKERRIRDGFVPQEDVERYTNARMDAAKTPTGYVPGLGVVTREVKGGKR
ncbi:hypothetical protein BC829DRAFT_363957 [Chytridium lagenaria]|nr:hypothetical protein BC829DRAFT_363957 [Chytridium lagenaria]